MTQHKGHDMTTIDGLRTGQAARLIGVSEQTIRALVRAGTLKSVSTPLGVLVDEDDAHRLAEQRDQRALARTEKGRR